MSLITTRTALLRPSTQRRMLLLVTVVLALVAGLLAMHTISTSMGAHGEPETAAAAMGSDTHHDESGTSGSTSLHDVLGTAECNRECGSGHIMAAMACVLALLATRLLLTLIRSSGMRTLAKRHLRVARTLHEIGQRSFAAPPDLVKLSISRT